MLNNFDPLNPIIPPRRILPNIIPELESLKSPEIFENKRVTKPYDIVSISINPDTKQINLNTKCCKCFMENNYNINPDILCGGTLHINFFNLNLKCKSLSCPSLLDNNLNKNIFNEDNGDLINIKPPIGSALWYARNSVNGN